MKSELQKVIKSLIDQRRGNTAGSQIQAEVKPVSSLGTAKDNAKTSQKEKVKVQDDIRLEVAYEIIHDLQSAINSNRTSDLSKVDAIANTLKSGNSINYLVDIARQVKGDPELV